MGHPIILYTYRCYDFSLGVKIYSGLFLVFFSLFGVDFMTRVFFWCVASDIHRVSYEPFPDVGTIKALHCGLHL